MAIFNPAGNALFWPTLYAFGGVLSVGLAGIVAVERARFDRIAESVLFERWRTWAIIAPAFALAVLGGPAPLGLLIAVTSVIAAVEFASVARLGRAMTWNLAGSGVAIVLASAAAPSLVVPVVVLALLRFAFLAIAAEESGVERAALAFLGLAWIPLLLGHALLLQHDFTGGAGVLLAVGVATALSDVTAFACGKLFGGRKLAPRISPNKTWSGAAGNLVGATAGFGLMWLVLPGLPSLAPWAVAAFPVVIAGSALAGDLFESLIKRSFGVKDAGGWLPGFGGILDRIDSLLFVLPAAYYFTVFATGKAF
jgi:phosphatidate cytidylyltransferase